ncbi:MAG: hypothetical protein M3450_00820 [Actinomycetota bacterium]|nr:hypothetical protein [Actinomycetota bacterium]
MTSELGEAFDPQRLTGEASLQRVVIASLPGGPTDIAGRPAAEVCSRDALAGLMLDTPGLPAPQPGRLADQLGELRSSAEDTVRELAGGVLRAYGVRLGALLATLMNPDTPAQQGGTPVRRAYLEHWLGIERVWLGGGLLVGHGAGDVLAGAQQLLSCAGIVLDVRIGRSPAVLPLLGAARVLDRHDGRALVADAGHSSIKAAVASVVGGALAALELLPPTPAPLSERRDSVEAALVTALVNHADAVDRTGHGRVVVSVASYLDDGAPVDDDRSIYGGITPDRVRDLVAAATGDDMLVEFVHDGSASALGIADPRPSAVVTVGTWLGIGFTPSNRRLLGGDPEVRRRPSSPTGDQGGPSQPNASST